MKDNYTYARKVGSSWEVTLPDEGLSPYEHELAPIIGEMAHRIEQGGELTGHDLARLYGFGVDDTGEFYYDVGEIYYLIQDSVARSLRYDRVDSDPAYRYKDHQKIHEALGSVATVGQQIGLLSEVRWEDYGPVMYQRYMQTILGFGYDDEASFDDFYGDPTVKTEHLLAAMDPTMQLAYMSSLQAERNYRLDLTKLASQSTTFEKKCILDNLHLIIDFNPSVTLGDVSCVTGVPASKLLRDYPEVDRLFGQQIINRLYME